MPDLHSQMLRIASELPKGDPTRRKLLAILSENGATVVSIGARGLGMYAGKIDQAAKRGDEKATKVNIIHALSNIAGMLNEMGDAAAASRVEQAIRYVKPNESSINF